MIGWTAFSAAPFVMGTVLWRITPREKRVSPPRLIAYGVIVTSLVGGALALVSWVAGASVPPLEVAIATWFTFSLRLAYELWQRALRRLAPCDVIPAESVALAESVARASPPVISRSGWRLFMAGLRVALTIAVFVPVALSFVLTHRFKLHDGNDPKSLLAASFDHVRIPTTAGLELDAWFVPDHASDRTIVICHGAGANKGNFIWFLPPLVGHGWNLVLFDLRAHGASDGRIGTYGLREKTDVLAVVDWLKRERSDRARRIVGLGSSQGAMALALAAAEDERIEAIVLDSPFASPRELAHHHLGRLGPPGRWFADLVLWEMSVWTGADFLHTSAVDAVRRLGPRPVLVIFGEDDVIMPRSHAEALFAAAAGPKALWIAPGPHSNIVTTVPEEYAKRVFDLLDRTTGG